MKLYQEEDHISQKRNTTFPIVPYKRYKEDFEELKLLGEGGGGRVYQVRNRVDGNIYCVKMVKMSRKNRQENQALKKEVDYQSRLQNQYVVRYYNAWVEHFTKKEDIEELNFTSSEEDEEESKDQPSE